MKAEGIRSALAFLRDLPELTASGRLSRDAVTATLDYRALAKAGSRCGYRFEPDEIAEAFRIWLRARALQSVCRVAP